MSRFVNREVHSGSSCTGNHVRLAGAVLAGGKSSRMGRFKEGIALRDRRPMIEHVISTLSSVCDTVIIAGACSGYDVTKSAGVRRIPDNYPGQGPLAGLEALLGSGIADGYLIAACDQPLITSQILRMLVDGDRAIPACFTDAGTATYPLPAYYPGSLFRVAQSELYAGRRSLVGFLSRTPVRRVLADDNTIEFLRGYNTPDEIAPLLRRQY